MQRVCEPGDCVGCLSHQVVMGPKGIVFNALPQAPRVIQRALFMPTIRHCWATSPTLNAASYTLRREHTSGFIQV